MFFYSFKNYLKDKFPGLKVYKIGLDAGFSCPHRTSDTRMGGCIYCENRSFSPYARLSPRPPISEQIKNGIEFYRRRYKADKFIVYFQAYTNTLGPVDKLKSLYDEALSHPDIVGFSIGTRPDCVPDNVLDLITEYTKKYLVWLEYGLQSANDETLEFINRGHKYIDFEDAVKRTKGRNISIATHLILGLPGEGQKEILQSVEKVINLGIDGIKFHHLYIAKNTRLAELYEQPHPSPVGLPLAQGCKEKTASDVIATPSIRGKQSQSNDTRINIKLFTLDEYIPLICDMIEILPPKMVVIRLTGELSGEYLIAPKWNVNKNRVIQMIEQELTRRDSYQGKKFTRL